MILNQCRVRIFYLKKIFCWFLIFLLLLGLALFLNFEQHYSYYWYVRALPTFHLKLNANSKNVKQKIFNKIEKEHHI